MEIRWRFRLGIEGERRHPKGLNAQALGAGLKFEQPCTLVGVQDLAERFGRQRYRAIGHDSNIHCGNDTSIINKYARPERRQGDAIRLSGTRWAGSFNQIFEV